MITTGAILDKYEVLEKVGEGGMASVFRGRHMTLGREVAIKVLHPHLGNSERNRVRFEREAQAIEVVTHPNILEIFDYSGRDAEDAWIITEFIEGPTLRELLDDVGAMMPEPAAIIAWRLCQALAAAHKHGIVHRDLKPENVMLDRTGEVKLMDFGIARVLADVQVTMTGALVGSPAYMSPEQATDAELDARSDLFSLGTVLYRMVTGALPFRGNNASVVLKAIIDGVYEDPAARVPSLDFALGKIIRTCLGREPSDRYPNAGAVGEALAAYLASVGIDPAHPGEWHLQRYIEDADGYEERLAKALIAVLIERGRSEAKSGDTAAALRTFNRVLALDEDNSEVVEFIEGMRRPLAPPGRSGTHWGLWVGPALIAVLAVGTLAWQTHGFTRFGSGPVVDATLPALPTLPRLSVHRAEVVALAPTPAPPPVLDQAPPQLTEDRAAERARALALREAKGAAPTGPGEAVPPSIVDPPVEETVAAVVEPPCVGPGRLIIKSLGTQMVSIDGGEAIYTPVQLELPAGVHRIHLPPTRFHFSQDFDVRVCGNEPEAEPALVPRLKPSRVRLEGYPDAATVLVDGVAIGTVADRSTIQLTEVRTYSIKLWLDGTPLAEHSVTRSTNPGDLLPGADLTLTAQR